MHEKEGVLNSHAYNKYFIDTIWKLETTVHGKQGVLNIVLHSLYIFFKYNSIT